MTLAGEIPQFVRRVKWHLARPLRLAVLLRASESIASWLVPASRAAPSRREAVVLLAPPGVGNIGDAAMIEAFLEEMKGINVVVIVRDRAAKEWLSSWCDANVHVHAIPGLIYGGAVSHAVAVRKFLRLLNSARSFAIIGADVMDGGYGPVASAARARIAQLSVERGVPARVLGFSWNGKPHHSALRAVGEAAQAGVTLYVRDPVSAGRARADGLQNVVECADIVFTCDTVSDVVPSAALRLRESSPRGLVLFNVSGLVGLEDERVRAYASAIDQLSDLGYGVLILPHVIRAHDDDLAACEHVFARVSSHDRVQLHSTLLQPAQIRALARLARFAVTGRMHLAIMCMMNGIPAVTVATQGKVEGLMELFDTAELCVDPDSLERLPLTMVEIDAQADGYRTRIKERLPSVKLLAERNFSGLRGA